MHKYWKQIAAGSLAVMLATPVPIQAAIKKSIYVGDVVSITAADLKVNKGYKFLSELNTIYSEAREKVGSAYSSIESGNNQNTNGNATGGGSGSNGSSSSLIDSIISNGDLSGLLPDKKKKTFTYEEFLELIKGQDSEIAQKYEEARKNMEDEQKKGDKESAKYIEDAIKKAMNGINPVTGEAYESTDHPLDINDSLADETQRFMDWVDGNMENENSAAEMEKENLDKMLEYIRDDVENNVLAGNHSLVNFSRLSEDDYINDELILERGDFEDQYTGHIPGMDGYKTIKYRCSKCGKIYSFSNVCDCGKFLLNYLYESDKYSNRLPFTDWWVSGFYEFDKDGEASNSSLTHATIKCGFCGKKLTAKAFDFKADKEDRFYYTSSGVWKCADCQGDYPLNQTDEDGKQNSLDNYEEWYGEKFNPYCDNPTIPVKAFGFDDGITDMDSYLEAFRETLSDDEKEKFDVFYNQYKENKSATSKFPASDEERQEVQDFFDEVYDNIKNTESGKLLTKGKHGWTDEELENFKNAIKEAQDETIPGADYWKDTEKIKDTADYDDNVNKIFAEWPADRDKWTAKQKEMYEQFKEKYESDDKLQETVKDLVDKGILSNDKTPSEILSELQKYITSFTTINDNVTVTVTVESTGEKELLQQQDYVAQGDVRVSIKGPKGRSVISDYVITDTLPYRFCPSSAGTYTIERKVRIYDVSMRLVTGIYKVSASVEMPDGTQMLLEEKEITRIKEDKSGLNTSNMREIGAPNITITVKDRQLDIDKKDFYDTERIS